MYQKTNWQSGDTITAAKLNKMEKGIAGLVIDIDTLPFPEVDGEQFSDVQTSLGEMEVYLYDFAELNGTSLYYTITPSGTGVGTGISLVMGIMEADVEPVDPTTIENNKITMSATTQMVMLAQAEGEPLYLMPTDTVFVKGTQDPK